MSTEKVFELVLLLVISYLAFGFMFVYIFNSLDEYKNLDRKTKILMRVLILILWPVIITFFGIIIWSVKQAIKILFGE